MAIEEKLDYVIVGAGIIGLATAMALRNAKPDARLAVIEKGEAPGRHQTGRNSGVIHAGVYYKPKSLKATLCRSGLDRTIAYCQENNVPFEQCGKMIVATDQSESTRLDVLQERASLNKLSLTRLGRDALREREPNIDGVSALHVKETGIVDYGAICRSLASKLIHDGVEIVFNTTLVSLNERHDEVIATTPDREYRCDKVIACAGLQSDVIADMVGLAEDFRIIPFRGEYFRLSSKFDNISKHLIYPVPNPAYPFLGVHLTKMIGGFVTVGPNAMLSFGRETYDRNSLNTSDFWRTAKFPGFWKLMAQNVRSGINEATGSYLKSVYLKRCQKYCPSLGLEDLQPHPTGIRAQAVDREGQMIEDFLIKQTNRTIHVCNAPSPAATSAFPIADVVVEKVLSKV